MGGRQKKSKEGRIVESYFYNHVLETKLTGEEKRNGSELYVCLVINAEYK